MKFFFLITHEYFRFYLSGPKGKCYPGYGIWDGLRASWFPNSSRPDPNKEIDFADSSVFSKTFIWYDTIMTFQSDTGSSESFTMHNTKIHKKNTNKFDKALKFKNSEEGSKSSHIVADIDTPIPILLFLSLAKPLMSTFSVENDE